MLVSLDNVMIGLKVSFVLEGQEKQEIDLGLLSYLKNKQLKQNLKEYASAKDVKVTGWRGDGEQEASAA